MDEIILNQLMTAEYSGRATRPKPDREHLYRYTHKEFLEAGLAEIFHENTKLTKNTNRIDDRTTSMFLTDETMKYATHRINPDYKGREVVELHEPNKSLETDVADAIRQRRSKRSYSGDGISRQKLSNLLYYSCGITHTQSADMGSESSEMTPEFRAYPSAGGLYPVEPYIAVLNSSGSLDRGLYYYVPKDHKLRKLGGENVCSRVLAVFGEGSGITVDKAAACLMFTAAFWRSKAKYGNRGYRFTLQESGHIMQNVQIAATSLGLHSVPVSSVDEQAMEDLLDVNGVEESIVYTGLVGVSAEVEDDE
ncbi:SagB/ThcOx family dehydrogenase [Natrialba sp. PRR66]|uniref:SagB/ThcOx family dehydrogenase n=1 Tax=Natrialba sp. PRR66 TaxID=3098146 RepID=UPI002B1E3DC8|nr:SagB/ThcOx family dehydrogenase [Natrialba sp. PRR66]